MAKVSWLVIVNLLVVMSAPSWAFEADDGKKESIATTINTSKKSIEQTIPLTVANIKGHETLYNEGWFIITSSEKALAYAKQHSIDSSEQAIFKAKQSIKLRTEQYQNDVIDTASSSLVRTEDLMNQGTGRTKNILSNTKEITAQQWSRSQHSAVEAWQSVINGYVYLADATEDSIRALQNVPSDYQENVKQDFNDLFTKYQNLRKASATNIQKEWDGALKIGEAHFQQAYSDSAQQGNSLTGLGVLLWGYVKGAYEGLFKPAVQSSWQVTKYSSVVAGEAIFLPIASTYILTKNSLQATGLAFYYAGKTTIEVLAPTLTGGFHASVSLLSAGSVPITYIGGTSMGMINQAASTVAAPTIATVEGVAKATADTLQYGALVTYDALLGTTKVFVNQFQSGVVLGYNALTAIPSHLLLGAANSAVFLLYDGPRLSLATLKGQVDFQGNTLQPGVLPVGSVVDLKALSDNGKIQLEILSSDPEVIEKVINEMPKDLKL